MLKNSLTLFNGQTVGRLYGSSTTGLMRGFYTKTELKNVQNSEGFEGSKFGIPNGSPHPVAWLLNGDVGGSMASYERLISNVSLSLAPGTLASISGSVTTNISFDVSITGIGLLNGNITPFTELSPKNLADAVWTADTTQYNQLGTTGKHLNSIKSTTDLIPALL